MSEKEKVLTEEEKPKKRKLTKSQVSSYKGGLEREGYTVIEPSFIKCNKCGKHKSIANRNYFKSNARIYKHYGHVPICRKCLEDMYMDIMKDNDLDEKLSLYYLFMEINVPWSERLWITVKGKSSKIGEYLGILNSNKLYREKTFFESDTFIVENDNMSEEDIEEAIKSNERGDIVLSAEDLKDLKAFWGSNYNNEDLVWLQERFIAWTTRHVCNEYSEEVMFKEIVYTQYKIHKGREKGEDVGKYQKVLQELMTSANVKPKDMNNANNGENKNAYSLWVEDIEKYRPAEYFEDKALFKDYDGLGKMFERFVTRPVKNLLTGSKDFDPEYDLDRLEKEARG